MTQTRPWLAHYEPDVTPEITVPDHTVQQFLVNAAARFPEQTAVRMVLRYLPLGLRVQARLSYRELHEQSDRFAAALAQLGVGKGSRVAIMLPNIPQQVIAYFGVLKAGAIVVNTNPTYPPHELAPLLRSAEAETIVTLSGLFDRVRKCSRRPRSGRSSSPTCPTCHRLALPQQRGEAGARQRHDGDGAAPGRRPFLPATAGQCTGHAAQHRHRPSPRHRRLPVHRRHVGAAQGRRTDPPQPGGQRRADRRLGALAAPGAEKFLLALPAFHVYGMTVGMLMCISLGGELVQMPDPRHTLQILETIAHEKITSIPACLRCTSRSSTTRRRPATTCTASASV
jgi:long-chain acyl-CoA synthetase